MTLHSSFLKVGQVAEQVGVSTRTVFNHLDKLPSHKICGARLFRAADLEKIKTILSKKQKP